MNTRDLSGDAHLIAFMEQMDDSAKQALKRKGQLVHDHPSADVVIQQFMTRVAGKLLPQPQPEPGNVSVPITQLPEPYPPCIVPEKDLEPICIAEMRLETHHRGKKVFIRVVTPPERINAVTVIVKDEKGTAILLQIYHQPAEDVVPCAQDIPIGTVFILKEPFFKQSVDGPYPLRVDHPGDLIQLDRHDERIPPELKPLPRKLTDSIESCNEGNGFVEKQQWSAAHRSYTQAIQRAQTTEEEQLASLSRSLANFNLDRPNKALSDAIKGDDPAAPTEQSLFLQARALYNLDKFEECKKKLQILADIFPDNQQVKPEIERVEERLLEQKRGNYDFRNMHKQTEATPPLIDCATFSSLVEIRNSPGRGQGLFTTEAVSAGDLILCEKAFAYCFVDGKNVDEFSNILINMSTKKVMTGGNAYLLSQIVQKLYHNPEYLPVFQDLCHGNYKKPGVTECDGNPVVDSFMVERIIGLNAFGAPRSSRLYFKERIFSQSVDSAPAKNEDPIFETSGIWLLAARINHCCIGNCRRSFIGDMQIIRVTKDMPAGTELLFYYRPPHALESYPVVQKHFESWEFVCACELCKERSKTTAETWKKRREIYDAFIAELAKGPDFSFAKGRQFAKTMEKTFHGKPMSKVRLELAELCAALGNRYERSVMRPEAIKVTVKSLESLGFIIVAHIPGESSGEPRLEVKRWGMSENFVVCLFLNLGIMYKETNVPLQEVAYQYAALAYCMIAGESVSMYEVVNN
ncbi:hypothetical protein F53441_4397 [Fusarium austroafricanum]|uniref:SET domain-containing protein n=1 Tax=Fusarium austroafricanum TaxID=2364996 RepID=A0A8H4KKG8_9HYPO|nr:hypothetical protein F53441_4397 [Fusarium austroafricanum]